MKNYNSLKHEIHTFNPKTATLAELQELWPLLCQLKDEVEYERDRLLEPPQSVEWLTQS